MPAVISHGHAGFPAGMADAHLGEGCSIKANTRPSPSTLIRISADADKYRRRGGFQRDAPGQKQISEQAQYQQLF